MVLTTERGLKARLTAVDLETGEVVTAVRLRSTALDMAVDPEERLVVTAQCGGVSTDADNALGVYDVDRGGRVHYVELEYPSPGVPVHTGGGRMVFEHGWMDSEGLVVGLFDARARAVVRMGRVPDFMGGLAPGGGALWGMSGHVDRDERELRRIDPETLRSEVVTTVPSSMVMSIVDAGGGRMLALVTDDLPPEVRVEVHRFDGTARSLESDPAGSVRFDDGPASGSAVIGDLVAIPDFSDVDPLDRGDRVLLFSSDGHRGPTEVRVPGGPVAVRAWGAKFVVLEQYTGRILTIDPATAAVETVAELGAAHGGWHSDLAIVP